MIVKKTSIWFLVFLFLFTFTLTAAAQDEVVTNAEVITLTKAGLDKAVILNKINTSQTNFNMSTDELIKLKQAGVSDEVVHAMLIAKSGGSMGIPSNLSHPSGPGTPVLVPDGTEIKAVTVDEVSGKRSVEGDQLTFKVADDVLVNGKVVIAKGAVVKATVTSAKKPGFAGTSGKLSIRIESTIAADGQPIKLRAAKSGQGGNNTGTTVGLVVLFGPLGLLKHGKDAKIVAGTLLSAYTDEAKTVMVVTP
ncbi:MAG: hypothetical protein ABJA02_07600 [Acidobacteriota bacterium]